MGKLSNIAQKATVREYAQGAAQRSTQPVAAFLAPPVEVSSAVGNYKVYTNVNTFKVPDTKRSLGGRAVQIGWNASDGTYNCTPNALDFPVDKLESYEDTAGENIFREAADEVAAVAALAHEKTVLDLAIATVGAGSSLSETSSDDVIDQMDAQILNVIKAAKYGSLMGVGVLMGATYWRKIKNHASVKGRFVSGGKSQFAVPTLNDFGRLLIAEPEVRTSFMVYDTAAAGVAESISFVLDKACLIFARMATPNRRDPSFMKTFRLRGQWMVPGAYETEDGRGEVAKMDWSEQVVVGNSAAAARLNVA